MTLLLFGEIWFNVKILLPDVICYGTQSFHTTCQYEATFCTSLLILLDQSYEENRIEGVFLLPRNEAIWS